MSIDPELWRAARRTVRRSILSSIHSSIASSNPDGRAHVTPIGSLALTDVGHATYFDIFNTRLAQNVAADPRVTIMVVDSSRPFWLRSLLTGRFHRAPGLRLQGEVGPARDSMPDEVAAFRRLLGPLHATRGGRLLWGDLPRMRDVRIHAIDPLRIGPVPVMNLENRAATPHRPADAESGPFLTS